MTIGQTLQSQTCTHTQLLTIAIFAAAATLSACSDSNDTSTPTGDNGTQAPIDTTGNGTQNPPDSSNNEPPVDNGGDSTTNTSARYRLAFTATWSQDTHALNFPGNPHFSGLVGAVHNEQVIFWEPGQIATPGIQLVAETGGKSDFLPEIQSAIDAGSALSTINEGGIGTSPGNIAIEFDVTRDYPQITVTSMLAPSPDWFVGLHNYSLISDGEFVENAQIDLVLYDGGSDDGVRYQSSNSATDPLSPIAQVNSEAQDAPFVNGEPLVGSITIELLSTN